MAEMITRCPKCDTAFRITSAHLKSAKGAVRCGSCLSVFNAEENLTKSFTTQELERETVTEDTIGDADDILIGDSLEDTEDYLGPPPKLNLFERAPPVDEETIEVPSPEDESWALDLLFDDVDEPSDSRSSAPTSMQRVRLDQQDQNLEGRIGIDDFGSDHDQDDSDFDRSSFSGHRNAYLDAIEPEPVEFALRADKPFWQRRWPWACLSTLALILLLGQIAWLQYPTLNRIEPYRGFYSIACNLLGCELPAQQDISAIRTSNLVVRSHPRIGNALMVDVILQNTAPFEQDFPELELTFSGMQSNPLAQRRFTPPEYLGGELSGQTRMPVRQPVHIALEIVDPGEKAVNYRIDILNSNRP